MLIEERMKIYQNEYIWSKRGKEHRSKWQVGSWELNRDRTNDTCCLTCATALDIIVSGVLKHLAFAPAAVSDGRVRIGAQGRLWGIRGVSQARLLSSILRVARFVPVMMQIAPTPDVAANILIAIIWNSPH